MAEMYGKANGCSRGRGGSMHFFDVSRRFYGGYAIVGGGMPIAVGLALADTLQGRRRVTACFFGDGAVDEGEFHESLNLAALWKLPVLFLCENNGKYGVGRAVAAAQSSTMAAYPLTDLPKAYKIPAEQVDGLDAGAVHAAVSEALSRIRRGEGPRFIEAQTVRWPGSESNWPVVPVPTEVALAWDVGTAPEKVRGWYRECDPALIFIRELVEEKQVTREEISQVDKNVRGQVAQAVDFALKSPYPDLEEALKDVFA